MGSYFKIGINKLFKSYFFILIMILPGHLALGYLVTYGLLKLLNPGFSAADNNFILLFGTIFGAIVDFDFISYFIRNRTLRLRNDVSHRDQISHAPLLWLIIGLIIFFFADDVFTKVIGLTVWISTWSHFAFDSFEHGIMWRYPFSKKKYSLFENKSLKIKKGEGLASHYYRYFFEYYPTRKTFWIELAVIVIFLIVYFH